MDLGLLNVTPWRSRSTVGNQYATTLTSQLINTALFQNSPSVTTAS